jgi:glycolate oxidase
MRKPENCMTLSRMPEPDRTVLDRSDAIIKDLETLIGVDGVISEEEGRRAFEADALTAYRQTPLAVVLPRSTEDVAKILKYCHQGGIKVVPRGAGTSLCGGALPTADSIVIGRSRSNAVSPTSPLRTRCRRRDISTLQTRRASSPARSAAISP